MTTDAPKAQLQRMRNQRDHIRTAVILPSGLWLGCRHRTATDREWFATSAMAEAHLFEEDGAARVGLENYRLQEAERDANRFEPDGQPVAVRG